MPMEKSEIECFASLLSEKERDIAVYEQAMIKFLDDALDSSRRLYRDGHLVFYGKDNV